MEPDLAGFREARERKRVFFAEPVVLLGPIEAVYPPGVPLDDDGAPLDPTVAPVASSQASAEIQVEFFWRSQPAGRGIQAPYQDSAVGNVTTQHPTLIAGSAASADLEGKTMFRMRNTDYKIESYAFDGITGIDRLLIYGSMK